MLGRPRLFWVVPLVLLASSRAWADGGGKPPRFGVPPHCDELRFVQRTRLTALGVPGTQRAELGGEAAYGLCIEGSTEIGGALVTVTV